MSDEVNPQEQETGFEEKNEPTIKELMRQMESLKQAQSGSDRKVKELSDALTQSKVENEELKKEQMSDKEKAKFELDKRERELAEKDAVIKAKEIALEKTATLTELEMPQKFAPWIHGNTKEELQANAVRFKAIFDDAVKEAANAKLVTTVKKPGSGDPPKPVVELKTFEDGMNTEKFDAWLKQQTG